MVVFLCLSTLYDRGFSFFSLYRANKETPDTLTTLNRTPGISPTYPRVVSGGGGGGKEREQSGMASHG